MHNLLIIGAGGHGKVVAETAECEGKWGQIAFLDDRSDLKTVLSYKIIGNLADYENYRGLFQYAFVAIGNNSVRLNWLDRLLNYGYKIPVIIHPNTYVSNSSIIDAGTIVLPGAVVNTSTKISRGCIININTCIDHDCEISEGVHIVSGAVVRSMSRIARLSYIGAGSCVKSGTCLGEGFILPDGKTADNNMAV